MTHCAAYWSLYSALVACCRQLTQRDGDMQTCTAIAARERDDGARREAAEKLREHAKRCNECHIANITISVL